MKVSGLFFLSLSSCLPFLSLYVDAKVDPSATSAVQSNWTVNLANSPVRLSTASAQRNLSLYENETVGGWVGVLRDFVFCLSDVMPCSLSLCLSKKEIFGVSQRNATTKIKKQNDYTGICVYY
jgi:hypothetical protein